MIVDNFAVVRWVGHCMAKSCCKPWLGHMQVDRAVVVNDMLIDLLRVKTGMLKDLAIVAHMYHPAPPCLRSAVTSE